jgi:hypothetical protein
MAATQIFDPETFDQIADRAPAGLLATSPAVCDFGIDSINGLPPTTPPAVIVDRLTVKGWTAISAKNGIAPDQIFLTLYNTNQKLYTKTRMSPRVDVNTAFGQPGMHDTGFTATIDVSRLNGGNYILGISRVYQGKMDSCSQFHLVFLIEHSVR